MNQGRKKVTFAKGLVMQWIKIFPDEATARLRIIADKPQLVVIGEKRICLTLHNNIFFAVQDRCTHNGESLSKGHVNYLGEVICPWHNYRFSLQTGRESSSRSADLISYPIRINEDGFFIGIF
ncbi:MAG: Rieske 2Fe-2S domain-containing protein [Cyclobacteriaceae bacterium]|nr:Rieske 2Fe-2S domain-containing protein [Cyclobacteriaceae bacterium]UYN86835.1 MAG: Rieske 2Fe-2S domain-containing protein [Cyclobacteriaceae bacterium]